MLRQTAPGAPKTEDHKVNILRKKAHELNTADDLDPLIERIGDAQIVMLGEASHGTHEYYTWRAQITRRLITEKGFNFIAVEGDWPDCYHLNRYIKSYTDDKSAASVLKQFGRWPTWMWANWEIVALSEWLHKHNKSLEQKKKVGFYGLDVYSLWESMEAIKEYLQKVDPDMLKVAEQAFKCFEPYKNEERKYVSALRMVPELCESEVINMLTQIQQKMPQYSSDYENAFSTEQNALVAVNAERYYRAMLGANADSWNVRDSHMEETLERLLKLHGPNAKAIIWEHNTHIGDARATDMIDSGMYNIGELARQKFSDAKVVLVGFGSYEGSVIAGKSWGATMRVMDVPKAINGSWEDLLHRASRENKLLIMDELNDDSFWTDHLDHRAIGVVYNPEYEHLGNYVPSILPLRYDAFLYIEHTKAVHPLHLEPNGHLVPETYPFGL